MNQLSSDEIYALLRGTMHVDNPDGTPVRWAGSGRSTAKIIPLHAEDGAVHGTPAVTPTKGLTTDELMALLLR